MQPIEGLNGSEIHVYKHHKEHRKKIKARLVIIVALFFKLRWHAYWIMYLLPCIIITHYHHTDDEVDGDAFLELTEGMLQSLIPKSGPRAKFIKKHKDLLVSRC